MTETENGRGEPRAQQARRLPQIADEIAVLNAGRSNAQP
jgi:hypothetical protein